MPDSTKNAKIIISAKDNTQQGMKSIRSGLSGVQKAAGLVGVALGSIGLAQMASEFVRVNKEFQSLEASLTTVTGSTAAAGAAMKNLEEFAKKTPFQLSEVVDSFIKMKALGLDPSNAALESFGNTASSMGKSLNQMIEAVADASTGEFERLKDFGITAKQQGDEVTFTFQGISTTIRKESSLIQNYLEQIGRVQFAGGSTRQMETLGGALSNLSDDYDAFWRNIGTGSTSADTISSVRQLSTLISDPSFISSMSALVSGVSSLATMSLSVFADEVERVGNAAKWMAAYSVGEIGLLEYVFTGPEGVAKKLKEFESIGHALLVARRHAEELRNSFRVTAADRKAYAEALERVALLEKQQADARVADLSTGAANLPAIPQDVLDKRNKPASSQSSFAGFGSPGIWELTAQHDLMQQKQIDFNNTKYATEIEAGQQMIDLFQVQANDRLAINDRRISYEMAAEDAANAYILNSKTSAMNQGIALVQMLGQKNKVAAIAAIGLQKGLAIGQTFVSGKAAEIRALAELGPIAGPPMAASIGLWTKINMGLIAATGVAQAALSGGGGGGTSGDGTYSSPVVTQPTAATQQQALGITFNVTGDIVDPERWFETKAAPIIRDLAQSRGIDFGFTVNRS